MEYMSGGVTLLSISSTKHKERPLRLLKDKVKDESSVVKGNIPTELSKDGHKADLHKDKPKPKDKHNVDSEVLVLRLKSKCFSAFHNVAIDKILSRLGRYVVENFNSATYRLSLDTGDYVKVTPSRFHNILELKDIRVGDIASKLVFAHEVDFLFKVNFLTLFTNIMGRVAGLKGQICLDVARRLREDCVISKIDWCGYIHSCIEDSKLLKKRTVQYLGPFTPHYSTKFDRFSVVHTRPAISTLMRQRQDLKTKEHVIGCLELHDEWTKSELQETEGFTRVSSLENFEREALFKNAKEKLATICSERVLLEDLMRKASSVYPGYVKFVELQEKYIQVFRDPISFDVDVSSVDSGNDSDGDDDNDQGNINEDLNDKEPLGSNLSFDFSKASLDDFDKQPSGSGKSPRTKENGFESHSGEFIVYGICLNMKTLALGLWIDANVIDCWGAIINHEERFRDAESKAMHFLPTGFITKSMFDKTLASDDDK
uniref:Uncharacterized protein n=1 Tax=Tanacetum cinerariifolium TaxID=118510 RepID=A0A699H0H4_TANCI|nr:hypothetical protein [Tanacetum cinerariifolium]